MKQNFLRISLLSILFIAFSCGDDDNGGGEFTGNYFPLATNNSWTYEKSDMTTSTSTITGQQNLSGTNFFVVDNPENIFGLNADILYVRKSGNDYFLSGEVNLQGQTYSISNEKFFDEGVAAGNEINTFLSENTGDPLDANIDNFVGTITPVYSYNTQILMENIYPNSTTINGMEYMDAMQSKWILGLKVELKIIGTYGGILPVNHTHQLVPEDPNTDFTEIGFLKQFFVNDIGPVRTEYTIDMSDVSFNTTITVSGLTFDISDDTQIQLLEQQTQAIQFSSVAEMSDYTVN